jgi:ABC-2 type transport system ATP-binding protein
MTPAVECRQLKKTFRLGFFAHKTVHALSGIDLTVHEGEVFGLIGPNGAGKSTAIKILLNLVLPTSGTASLFGIDVRKQESRRNLGYVPESPVPYEYLTGGEYLAFQSALAGLTPATARTEMKRVLERVDMARHSSIQIRRYSKGMTQRIMLAGALLGRPRLVVLDEPTSGLDPMGRRLVRDLIVELRREGAAVLFCTHIISDVESLCDRVALLMGGVVQRTGTVDELVGQGNKTYEVIVEKTTLEAVGSLVGTLVSKMDAMGQNILFHINQDKLQIALQRLIEAGISVSRVHAERFTLEDTFVEALKQTSHHVGGVFE